MKNRIVHTMEPYLTQLAKAGVDIQMVRNPRVAGYRKNSVRLAKGKYEWVLFSKLHCLHVENFWGEDSFGWKVCTCEVWDHVMETLLVECGGG